MTQASYPSEQNRAPARFRSFFWPGFIVGFLLLAAISCGGLAMATGLGRLDFSDLQAGGAAWTPPTLVPTPAVADSSADGAAAGATEPVDATDSLSFQPGELARNVTSTRVNVRQKPGYLGKPEGDIIAQLLPGDMVEILGDRTNVDNLQWWRVRFVTTNGAPIEGWVAEATAGGVQILGSE